MSYNDSVATAIRQELCKSIMVKAQKGHLSLVEELMGYSLAEAALEKQYFVRPVHSVPPARRLAIPELLTGLVRCGRV